MLYDLVFFKFFSVIVFWLVNYQGLQLIICFMCINYFNILPKITYGYVLKNGLFSRVFKMISVPSV